jgi:uncharacterized protein involved in type VI secretion and phage assembly
VKRYYGKYRGSVTNNVDPMQIGRVQVEVPGVRGAGADSWAMPCAPVAGPTCGVFAVPPVGGRVWVEFEQGDAGRPIWVGGYWSTAAEVPVMLRDIPPGVFGITMQTTAGNGLTISDALPATGGILIRTQTGAMISVTEDGIVISNGKGATISLTGPTTDINAGALTVV